MENTISPELLQHIDTFASILQLAGTEDEQAWKKSNYTNAMQWATQIEKVMETMSRREQFVLNKVLSEKSRFNDERELYWLKSGAISVENLSNSRQLFLRALLYNAFSCNSNLLECVINDFLNCIPLEEYECNSKDRVKQYFREGVTNKERAKMKLVEDISKRTHQQYFANVLIEMHCLLMAFLERKLNRMVSLSRTGRCPRGHT